VKQLALGKRGAPITASLFMTAVIFLAPQLLLAFALSIVAVVAGANASTVSDWLGSTWGNFTLSLLVYGLMPVVMWLFVRKLRTTWHEYGVRRAGLLQTATFAICGIMVYYITLLVTLSLASAAGIIDPNQEQQIGFSRDTSGPLLVLVFVGLVALPAFVEELLFRGFLFTHLRKVLSFSWTTVVVSVGFGLLHLQLGSGSAPLWSVMIDTTILSVVLCYVREKTGTIWAGVLIHALKNSVAFIALFLL